MSDSLEEGLSVVVEPAVVVGFDVGPSGLKLISEVPEELTLNGVVEDVRDAVAENLDISSAKVIRVG
jgi:hypothetical protein